MNPERKVSASALEWEPQFSLSWNQSAKEQAFGIPRQEQQPVPPFSFAWTSWVRKSPGSPESTSSPIWFVSNRRGLTGPGLFLRSSLFAYGILFDPGNCPRAISLISFLEIRTFRAPGPVSAVLASLAASCLGRYMSQPFFSKWTFTYSLFPGADFKILSWKSVIDLYCPICCPLALCDYFNIIKIRDLKIHFLGHTSRISSALQPPAANGSCIGQDRGEYSHRCRKFYLTVLVSTKYLEDTENDKAT